MNLVLKRILEAAKETALDTASKTIPGAGPIISGVTRLLDHNDSNNAGAIEELEDGLITAVTSLDPAHVSNATLLAEAVTELRSAFSKLKTALKK